MTTKKAAKKTAVKKSPSAALFTGKLAGRLAKLAKKYPDPKDKRMSEQDDKIIELQGKVEELTTANEELAQQLEDLTKENGKLKHKLKSKPEADDDSTVEQTSNNPRLKVWVRGILPGEKYIKTNQQTGEVVAITKAEWDTVG